jgi:hypothetical protein
MITFTCSRGFVGGGERPVPALPPRDDNANESTLRILHDDGRGGGGTILDEMKCDTIFSVGARIDHKDIITIKI